MLQRQVHVTFELLYPLLGEYGLRNKREVWRVKFTLAKIRKAARELLTLDEKDQRRLFEGMLGLGMPVFGIFNGSFAVADPFNGYQQIKGSGM